MKRASETVLFFTQRGKAAYRPRQAAQSRKTIVESGKSMVNQSVLCQWSGLYSLFPKSAVARTFFICFSKNGAKIMSKPTNLFLWGWIFFKKSVFFLFFCLAIGQNELRMEASGGSRSTSFASYELARRAKIFPKSKKVVCGSVSFLHTTFFYNINIFLFFFFGSFFFWNR